MEIGRAEGNREKMFLTTLVMDSKKSPHFTTMAQKLNEWGSWTLKEILKHQDVYDRVNALALFIEISKVPPLPFLSFVFSFSVLFVFLFVVVVMIE